jgi:hypothetical protein
VLHSKVSLPSVFCGALGKDFAERLILLSAKKMDVTAEETVTDICRVLREALSKVYALCRVS